MKRITRYLVTAAGFVALAGAPSMFGADFHHDHLRAEHERLIRQDQARVRRDLARHDYRAANRDRAILHRDENWR